MNVLTSYHLDTDDQPKVNRTRKSLCLDAADPSSVVIFRSPQHLAAWVDALVAQVDEYLRPCCRTYHAAPHLDTCDAAPDPAPTGEVGNDGSREMAHRSSRGLGARLDEAHALADLDDHRWDVA